MTEIHKNIQTSSHLGTNQGIVMTQKWSETDKQGVKYTRILDRLLLKMDRMTREKKDQPATYDMEQMLNWMQKAGWCLQVKTNVGLKTDWERRVKYLEGINNVKKKHEELVTK